jgi:hypothetical protein
MAGAEADRDSSRKRAIDRADSVRYCLGRENTGVVSAVPKGVMFTLSEAAGCR